MRLPSALLSLGLGFAAQALPAAVTPYEVGETVFNFNATRLLPGSGSEKYRLYNQAGKIVFVDQWSYWCPNCTAFTGHFKSDLIDYYRARGGRNAHGVEVQFVLMSLDPTTGTAVARSYTDDFDVVLEVGGFSFEHLRFVDNSATRPVFVLINGLAGATDYAAWELMYLLHDGKPDWASTVKDSGGNYTKDKIIPILRELIDSVKPKNELVRIFPSATESTGGWYASPWFGWMNSKSLPWIFHQDQGWIHVSGDSQGIWVYDRALAASGKSGYWYTTPEFYPGIYEPSLGWVYYVQSWSQGQDRWVYRYATATWETWAR